jgi:tetratricopeptide (TPR) repeat protein
VSLKGLAEIFFEEGEYRRAEEYFQRALSIQEKKFGTENPRILETLKGYAETMRKLDHRAEAEKLEARAAAINSH